MKSNVVITTDSHADLSAELESRYDIRVLPLYVNLGGKSYRDGIDITTPDIFRHYNETGELPTTSAIPIGDYEAFFKSFIDEGKKVVHFSLSSEISSTHQNARLAAEGMDGVYVIDSRHLSSGIALQVIRACEMRDEGMSAEDIAKAAVDLNKKTCTSFVLDKLEYMKKGGRCSTVAALGANLLSIRPCIEMKDGKLGVARKYRGKILDVKKKYIEDELSAHKDDADLSRIFLTSSSASDAEVKEFTALIKSILPFKEVLIGCAGCTIASHCGPGCMGILFMTNKMKETAAACQNSNVSAAFLIRRKDD